MSNPIDEFLMAKQALGPMPPLMGRLGKKLLESGSTGLGFAGMSAGVAGVGMAATHLFNAVTKKRDFDNMMEANPHLALVHQQDPEGFGRMYTSLRSMNPEFSRDPLVAGSFMTTAMEGPVQDRGYIAVKARERAAPMKMGPLAEAAHRGFGAGASMKLDGPKPATQEQQHLPHQGSNFGPAEEV